MSKNTIITLALVLLLTLSIPTMAEADYIDLNDYNLDLTVEQRIILEEELSTFVDISGEIDLGLIKIILGELEEDGEFEEDYDQDSEKINYGQGLAQRIKEFKANNEDWTGQELSNMIQNYKENNSPPTAANDNANINQNNKPGVGNNPDSHPVKDNHPGKGNNPGKGNQNLIFISKNKLFKSSKTTGY